MRPVLNNIIDSDFERAEKENIFDELRSILATIKEDHKAVFSSTYSLILELEEFEVTMERDSALIGQMEIELVADYFNKLKEILKIIEFAYSNIASMKTRSRFSFSDYYPESFSDFQKKIASRNQGQSSEAGNEELTNEEWQEILTGDLHPEVGEVIHVLTNAIKKILKRTPLRPLL